MSVRARPTPVQRLDDVLFGPESPARLVAVQALFLVVIGVRTVLSPYPKLSPAPPVLFRPVPLLRAFDRMPPRAAIISVQVLVVLAIITWFWVGRAVWSTRSRWRSRIRRYAFALAWLGFFALAACRASRGKIFHIELLLVWSSLPLVFAPGYARGGPTDARVAARDGRSARRSV